MKNNHRTIFTQSVAEEQTLDAPTARLIQYCYNASIYEKFVAAQSTLSDTRTSANIPHYIHVSIMRASIILILEAASRLSRYYSKEFYQELSTFSPLTVDYIRVARFEDRLWHIVRNQLF